MSARRPGRTAGRLAAVARTAQARLRHGGRRAAAALLLAGVGAWAGAVLGLPAPASGEAGAPTETGTSPTTTAGVWCSTFNRRVPRSAGDPVKLTAGVGSTQSTPAGTRFPIRLAVTVTNAAGNPVPGAPVTFSAPLTGASGRFTAHSGSPHHHTHVYSAHTVTVKTDACGIAVAPAFTADDTQGGYVVRATLTHVRPAAFALVNEAPGRSW